MANDTSGRPTSVRDNARGIATRARLLDAAVQSFSERGFHATSTRDIADAAGMSPAAVYTHFETKEQLLFQIAMRGHQDVDHVTARALVGVDDDRLRLSRLVESFVHWHAELHVSARVIQYEMAALTPPHHAEVNQLRRGITRRFRGVLDDGIGSGAFRSEEPGLTTMILVSMGIDVARWYEPGGPWTADAVARHYGVAALQMVTA